MVRKEGVLRCIDAWIRPLVTMQRDWGKMLALCIDDRDFDSCRCIVARICSGVVHTGRGQKSLSGFEARVRSTFRSRPESSRFLAVKILNCTVASSVHMLRSTYTDRGLRLLILRIGYHTAT